MNKIKLLALALSIVTIFVTKHIVEAYIIESEANDDIDTK